MYTIKYVEEALKEMKEMITEGKCISSLQDDLFTTILANIAGDTCEDPRECARQALRSLNFASKSMKEE